MQYEMIPKAEAPAQGPERRKRRLPEVEELVKALDGSTVARIKLGEDERPRQVVEQIFKTGVRLGRPVDVWEVGGFLYVETVKPDDA